MQIIYFKYLKNIRTFQVINVITFFLLFWLIYIVIIFNQTVRAFFHKTNENGAEQVIINEIEKEISTSLNQDLRTSTKDFANKHQLILNHIEEFWFYIQSEQNKLKADKSGNNALEQTDEYNKADTLNKVLDMTSQFKRSLMTNMAELRTLEGGQNIVANQNAHLKDLIRARLQYIQNPADCATARKVSCMIDWPCGFGCQLHHVTYCLIIAYATNRTLVLDSSNWNYNSGGWEDLFEPLSRTCRTATGNGITIWPNYGHDKQIIKLTQQTYGLDPKTAPGFIPRAVPQDIAAYLIHAEPIVWWVGQIVSYIFTPNAQLRAQLSAHATKIGFTHPIVGVHIRRSDKIGTEADAHPIEQYMQHVVEYYDQLSLRVNDVTRRVYVATDDRTVIGKIRARYPDYTVLGDEDIARAADTRSRYTKAGLTGIVTDLWFLSHSDYLVCTFSSQICRIAYELLNSAAPGDASLNYKSLDDIWYFAGQLQNRQEVLEDHTPLDSNQIELRVGDLVGPEGNHWDGYSLGTNFRTGQRGLYPSFKVKSKLETYPFPTYPEVKIRSG
uniref:Alpha-(1,6)-fucosyltransferase n=2 Tax=Cacopsylla melanoneura TaxID=428564 RepID=A0A8D8PQ04_9HEMI